MPQLDPGIMLWLAGAANVVVQLIKGLLKESLRRWIPAAVLLLWSGTGAGLAAYYGRDVVAGVWEGFFAGAAACGIYKLESAIPGLNRVFSRSGWLRWSDQADRPST